MITFFGKFFTISLDMFVWHWRQKHVWLVFFSDDKPEVASLTSLIDKKNRWKCKIIRFLLSSWFSAKMPENVIVVRPFKVWKLFFFSCHWLLISILNIPWHLLSYRNNLMQLLQIQSFLYLEKFINLYNICILMHMSLCVHVLCINWYVLVLCGGLYSSPEPKTQISFSEHILSGGRLLFCQSTCKLFIISIFQNQFN